MTSEGHAPDPRRAANGSGGRYVSEAPLVVAATATFESILAECPGSGPGAAELRQPDFFGDLNLDQVLAAMTVGREQYDVAPVFCAPLHDADGVTYRHEVLRDLENVQVAAAVGGAGVRGQRPQ